MAGIFDSKYFNAEVFQRYTERVPNTRLNLLLKSNAIRQRPDLATSLKDEVGGNYISTPLHGLIGGSAQNYDGETDITPDTTKTFMHSRVVVGRAKAWEERDFSFDITGGVDFMANVAAQTVDYWNMIDQNTITSILKGVFSMSDTEGAKFVASHTNDVTGTQNADGKTGMIDATTLNTGIQKAAGDNKSIFSLAIMHSYVATNLENLNLLTYVKGTDANGMQRDTELATLNGRLVMIDDTMPVEVVKPTYAKTSDAEIDSTKTYYNRSGSASAGYTYTPVANPSVSDIGNYYEMTSDGYTNYTTYILGNGAIEYTNCGAKVASEMSRDPAKYGGKDILYTRQRKCWAPYGISFTKSSMAKLSPTDAELEMGANWSLVSSTGETTEYINTKAIPIARIISRG